MRRLLIAGGALAILATTGRAHSQAWVQAPGGYYASVRSGYFSTETEFNHRGDRQALYAEDPARNDVRYREIYADGYLEYGILRRATLVTSLAFKNVRTWENIRLIAGYPVQEAIRTNYGLADLWLSLRTPVVQRRVAVALQCGLKAPLGYDTSPPNQGPPLGTGELDGDFGVHAGISVTAVLYASAGGGYRVRGGPLNDEWWVGGEMGGTWCRAFTKVRLEAVRNTEDPTDIAGQVVETPLPGGLLNQVVVGNQNVTKFIGATAIRVAGPVAITGEIHHVLSGANTLAGTTFVFGLVSKSR